MTNYHNKHSNGSPLEAHYQTSEARKDARLARWEQADIATLSRKQILALLRRDCPPHKKVCAWCYGARRKKMFAAVPRNKDGLDSWCVLCRRINDHLRRYKPANERYV